jgi:hypothetical protein
MNRLWVKLPLPVAVAAILIGCSGTDEGGYTEVSGETTDALVAADGSALPVDSTSTSGPRAAVGNVAGGLCSSVLVAPTKVLTGGHCVCPGLLPANVTFPQAPSTVFGVVAWHVHPAYPCPEQPDRLGDDSAVDLAVLELDRPVPSSIATPENVFLDNMDHWMLNVGTRLTGPGLAVGGGDPQGVWTRRFGAVNPAFGNDPCGLGVEGWCTDRNLWQDSLQTGANIIGGDSGGPLYLNDGLAGGRVVVGITMGRRPPDPSCFFCSGRDVWATPSGTPAHADWLADRIDFPFTRTIFNSMGFAAIRAKTTVRVNDRARVIVPSGNPANGGGIIAGGYVRIGVDAFAGGEVLAKGIIDLSDRALVAGMAQSSSNVAVSNGATALGGVRPFRHVRLDDFNLNEATYTAGTQPIEVPNGQQSLAFPGSSKGHVVVRARGKLTVFPGLHVWKSLLVEPDATLEVLSEVPGAPPRRTWIYVMDPGGSVTLRGAVNAIAGRFMMGVPNATSVILGASWRGTLVAPSASVVADMVTGAKLVGSFFSSSFELHQGRHLDHVPFEGRWVPVCDLTLGSCF